jgi:hypothetical protein
MCLPTDQFVLLSIAMLACGAFSSYGGYKSC